MRRLGKVAPEVAGEGAGCAWIDVGASRARNVDEAASDHAELHQRSACYVARGRRVERRHGGSRRGAAMRLGRDEAWPRRDEKFDKFARVTTEVIRVPALQETADRQISVILLKEVL